MGAVFAGAARAPITAVVILFELTGEYTIILPLMTAIVLATGVSHLLSGDTIYTLKLRRRGVDLDDSPVDPAIAALVVAQAMEPAGGSVPQAMTLRQVAGRLSRARHGQLAVHDEQGRYRGIITARAVADTLADGQHDDVPAGDLLEHPTAVRGTDLVQDTLQALESTPGAIPVLDAERVEVVGWLSHQRVLASLTRPAPASPARPAATAGSAATAG